MQVAESLVLNEMHSCMFSNSLCSNPSKINFTLLTPETRKAKCQPSTGIDVINYSFNIANIVTISNMEMQYPL